MSKKPNFASNSPFEGGVENNSHFDVTSSIFGDIAKADAQVERIQPIDIFSIYPDPIQPRRPIPSVIRSEWNGHPEAIGSLFQHWLEEVKAERGGKAFDLTTYLEGNPTERLGKAADEKHVQEEQIEDDHANFQPGALESALLTIVDLAASIRAHGLTNPISIANFDETYQIETGERRWLAYHLLYSWLDDRPDEQETWRHIPARIVKNVSVWRQAAENNARANLNAIGRTRQFAVLMFDLIDADFLPFHQFDSERQYYAQIVDHKVPYGKGEQLLNALGISSRSVLSRYRNILRLPDVIWHSGDDLNLPEEMLDALSKLPEEEALQQFQTVLGQNDSGQSKAKPKAEIKDYAPGTKRHFTQAVRAITKAGHGKDTINRQALHSIKELRQWLDEQEAIISSYLE